MYARFYGFRELPFELTKRTVELLRTVASGATRPPVSVYDGPDAGRRGEVNQMTRMVAAGAEQLTQLRRLRSPLGNSPPGHQQLTAPGKQRVELVSSDSHHGFGRIGAPGPD